MLRRFWVEWDRISIPRDGPVHSLHFSDFAQKSGRMSHLQVGPDAYQLISPPCWDGTDRLLPEGKVFLWWLSEGKCGRNERLSSCVKARWMTARLLQLGAVTPQPYVLATSSINPLLPTGNMLFPNNPPKVFNWQSSKYIRSFSTNYLCIINGGLRHKQRKINSL